MPEQMLQYRAAAFFIRLYAPEISNGMSTVDELHDIVKEPTEFQKVEISTIIEEEGNKIDIQTGEIIEKKQDDIPGQTKIDFDNIPEEMRI